MKRTYFWITRLQPFPFNYDGIWAYTSQIISLLHKPQKQTATFHTSKDYSSTTTTTATSINPSWEEYTTDVKTSWQRFATVLFHSLYSFPLSSVPSLLRLLNLPFLHPSEACPKGGLFESSLATDLWVKTNTNTRKRWLHQMDPLQGDVLQT